MSSSSVQSSSPVAQWRAARRLFPIYCTLAAQFSLEAPPYDDLDHVKPDSDPDFINRVMKWFDAVDAGLHVAQFRLALQNTAIAASEEKLQALIDRHYTKPEKTEADRDKLDFLLVQYFSFAAPPTLSDRDLTLENAAEVLAPILGPVRLDLPEWLRPIEGWVGELAHLTSLSDLQSSHLVQQGRQLKATAKHLYFVPTSLVAFTRFSYLLRRTYFRLISVELKTIDTGLEKLMSYGVMTLDCSSAQLSASTPISELRHFCETYKKPAVPEYSVDTSILKLIQIRQIVDAQLTQSEMPDDPILAEIEERCRRVEAELLAMRKLAARMASERRATSRTPAAAASAGVFEEVLEIPFEVPAAAKDESVEPLAEITDTASAPAPVPAVMPIAAEPPVEAMNVEPDQVAAAPTQVSESPEPSLTDAMEEIRKKLAAAPRKGISSLNIAGTALLLSPDEVEAFIRPKDGSSIDLQRSLAARALLLQAVELQKKMNSPELLSKTMQLCRTEAASIQQHSAEAKQANNNTTAATLNASASQLLSLLRQVERISRAS